MIQLIKQNFTSVPNPFCVKKNTFRFFENRLFIFLCCVLQTFVHCDILYGVPPMQRRNASTEDQYTAFQTQPEKEVEIAF